MMATSHPPGSPGEELVTFAECARRLGVTVRTVQEWARAGKLPVYEISPHRRYVVWSALAEAAQEQAAEQLEARRKGRAGKPATMRRSRPDKPRGET